MWELGRIIRGKGTEHFSIKTKDVFREDGMLMRAKGLEDCITPTGICTKECTKIASQTVQDSIDQKRQV